MKEHNQKQTKEAIRRIQEDLVHARKTNNLPAIYELDEQLRILRERGFSENEPLYDMDGSYFHQESTPEDEQASWEDNERTAKLSDEEYLEEFSY